MISLRLRPVFQRRPWGRARRPLAAVLAGLATVIGLTALRSDPPQPRADAAPAPAVRPGEVTVPVTLSMRAVADTLSAGDIVDLVTVDDDGDPHRVAERARVVDRPTSGSGLAPTEAIVLVAVPEADALDLAAAASQSSLALLIHPPADDGSLDSSS